MAEVIIDGTGSGFMAAVTSDNRLKVDAELNVSDIEIGAVEIKDGDSDNRATVNTDGQLHVVLMGAIDDGNSTTSLLNADEVFTGTAFETLDYGFIFVTIFSDVTSATDGLSFQQSSDGTNWDNTDDFNYLAGTGKTYSIQPGAKWFRIVYTNGGTNQSVFRLSTLFKKTSSLASSHRISDNLSVEDDATLGISIIKGQNPGGAYVDFNATTGGNFKISLEEYESAFFIGSPLPVREYETTPTDSTKNNPAWKFEYDTQNNIGSVTEFIGTGSFVNVLTWTGYSGTSIGVGSNITNIGSFF